MEENRYLLFERALKRIEADPDRDEPWNRPWKGYLPKPNEDTKGVPYSHVIQVRPDIERLIMQHGIDVRLAETVPGYSVLDDHINIPRPSTFKSKDLWYATLFHEMGHWTAKRVNRPMGDHPVAVNFEEVVAELTAAFLCEAFNVKGKQHACYIDDYAAALPPFVLKAAMSYAVKATNYLLQK